MPFTTNSRVPGQQGTIQQQPSSSNGGITNNVWIIGNRLLLNSDTYLAPIIPQSGYPLYEYYEVYQLPSTYANNSTALLTYFKNCGFNVGIGYTNSSTLYGASSVIVNDDDTLTVTFDNINTSNSTLIQSLTSGDNITGTWSSGENSGTYISCSIIDNNAVLVLTGTSGQISVSSNVTLTFEDSSIAYPDITLTDQFIVRLFYAALANSLIVNTDSTNFLSPNIWFTILPDSAHCEYDSPSVSSFTNISAPINIDGAGSSIILQIPTNNSKSSNPVGYIPYSKLGTSKLSQTLALTGSITPDNINTTNPNAVVLSFLSSNSQIAQVNKIVANSLILSGSIDDTTNIVDGTFISASAVTGTYSAQIIISVNNIGDMVTGDAFTIDLTGEPSGIINNSYISGNYIIVSLINTQGVFYTTGGILSLNLDSSQTIFALQQNTFNLQSISLSYFHIPYYITSFSDLNTKYKSYSDYLTLVNGVNYKSVGQGICKLLFEADPSIISNINTAPTTLQAITGTTGNPYYIPIYNNYQNTPALSTSIPIIEGVTSAVAMVAIGSNSYTSGNSSSISPMTNLLLPGLPITLPTDDTAGSTPGLVSFTNNPVDQIQQVGWNATCVNNNGVAYMPFVITNQLKIDGVADNALYPEYIWQALNYVELGILYPINTIYNGKKQNEDNYVTVQALILAGLSQMESDEVLINTDNNSKYITVDQSSINIYGVLETLVIQVYGAWLVTYYTINVYNGNVVVSSTPVNTN